jgi:integrase
MAEDFTVKLIESLKPAPKAYLVREKRGFAIRVLPSGVKTWLFIYTYNKKKKWFKLGQYPSLSLKEARIEYNKAYKEYQKGESPAEKKQQKKKAGTVEELAEYFIERGLKQKGNRSWKEYKRNLDKDVIPAWGDRNINDIKKNDVIELLEKIVDRGSKNQSNQVFKIVRRMFNFAIERDLLENTPCYKLKPLTPENRKERKLSDSEIVTFWHGLDKAYMDDKTKRILKLVLLTGLRPGEVAGARVSEFEKDWWTIPAERSKNKREHKVYLTPLIKQLFEFNDKTDILFLSPKPIKEDDGSITDRPINVNAVDRALNRTLNGVAKKNGDFVPPAIKMKSFTPHDLRRTAASKLASLGFGVIVDKILNHTDRRVTAIYDHYDYAKEKQMALEALSDNIQTLVSERPEAPDNVIPLFRKP